MFFHTDVPPKIFSILLLPDVQPKKMQKKQNPSVSYTLFPTFSKKVQLRIACPFFLLLLLLLNGINLAAVVGNGT